MTGDGEQLGRGVELTGAISTAPARSTDPGVSGTAAYTAPRPNPIAALGPARILVTDNRAEMALAIDHALMGRYTCELASNLEQAREMLADGPFDLAFCDVSAGGEGALVLAEEIAGCELDTAVILIVGKDDPALARKAIDFGAYGCVVEPPSPGQLLTTTISVLRQRELEIAQGVGNSSAQTGSGRDAVRLREELATTQQQPIGDLTQSRQETIEGLADGD